MSQASLRATLRAILISAIKTAGRRSMYVKACGGLALTIAMIGCGGLSLEDNGASDAGRDVSLDRAPDHLAGEVGLPDAHHDFDAVDVRVPCGPMTSNPCVDGCCTATGECLVHSGETSAQCGIGGASCAPCSTGQLCDTNEGQCGCNEVSCHGGCCSADGRCVPFGSQSSKECGSGGLSCGACDDGDFCADGSCTCGGFSCGGCCRVDDTCIEDPTPPNWACGSGGAVCTACAAGQECDTGGQCVCNPTSCPTGCCTSRETCEPYDSQSNLSCGTGGAACAVCDSGSTCGPSGACSCTGPSCADSSADVAAPGDAGCRRDGGGKAGECCVSQTDCAFTFEEGLCCDVATHLCVACPPMR